MECVAVIAEFNPFHNGHALLARQIKEAYPEHALIAIMSGNTVQRGDFAILDKYDRAKIAVQNGFDAVVELPFPYSCSAGEQFARAGVYIADAIGAGVLAFGSECGDLAALTECAANLSSPEFLEQLDAYTARYRDISVITARNDVYLTVYDKELPVGSNDILALEYLKALSLDMSPITPYVVHRTENFRATDARAALKTADTEELKRLLPNGQNISASELHKGIYGLSSLILGALRLDFGRDNGNGIVNSMKSCAKQAGSFDGFVSLLPTKTYTMARLRREMIAYLFGVNDDIKNEKPGYTVLLAANKKGQNYIASARKGFRIPLVTRMAETRDFDASQRAQLERAAVCDSVYSLGFAYPVSPMPFKTPYIEK